MLAIAVFTILVALALGALVYSFAPPPPRQLVAPSIAQPAPAPLVSTYYVEHAFQPTPSPVMTSPAPVPPPPPAPVWRATLSPDPAEQHLLLALRTRPADAEARMVYADWLEQAGRAAEASFVRGVEKYPETQTLVSTTDASWRAITCRERAECTGLLGCPKTWDAFSPSADDERRRDCRMCGRAVRYCADRDEQQASIARGEHTVIDLGAVLPAKPH